VKIILQFSEYGLDFNCVLLPRSLDLASLQCFLEGTKFEDDDWNNIYDMFLGPDELHTILGVLFGTHFHSIFKTCASKGMQIKLLAALDKMLVYVAETDKPQDLRLPSNHTHFLVKHNCANHEKGGVLEVNIFWSSP
jgi:hypothetical protein